MITSLYIYTIIEFLNNYLCKKQKIYLYVNIRIPAVAAKFILVRFFLFRGINSCAFLMHFENFDSNSNMLLILSIPLSKNILNFVSYYICIWACYLICKITFKTIQNRLEPFKIV